MLVIAILFAVVILFFLVVYVFMQQPSFGRAPQRERLHRVKQSPNYRNGQFQNQSVTPQLTEGANFFTVMREFFFTDKKRRRPHAALPSVKTDLKKLAPAKNIFIWFGHSSYFLQIDGRKILIDPVFSGHASPLSTSAKSFEGSDIYGADDMPEIDYLFLTHDHWDHLDQKTLLQLRPR